MRTTIIFLCLCGMVYAAPYRCDSGLIFADSGLCTAICGSCTEQAADNKGLQACDSSKYRGFVYFQGKTYALTNSTTSWDAEKAAIITHADSNALLSKILGYYSVANAWIGAEDKNRSGNFNSVDATRFRWRDNAELTYSNWANSQPDNRFSGSDIGNVNIYGEHWAAMRSDGHWHDTGSKTKYHSFVQFDTKLACVSGKDAADSNSPVAQEVCGNDASCIACVDPNADHASFDMSAFKKCQEGLVFGLSSKRFICPVSGRECNITEVCSDTGVCKRSASCPVGNYPCVQTNTNEDKYYCSPVECADIADPASFIDDEVPTDTGDQQDAGFDAEGNCIGQIYLFNGENKQCRLQSIKNPLGSCCQANNAWKPRFRCNDAGTMYDDAAKCGEICGKPCDLLKDQPPDLDMDILGIPLDICKAEEKELAFRRSMFPSGGNCKYIGSRCSERWKFGFGSICVQRNETYCCYQTPLAKTVMDAAHAQLGISWGSAGSPNCRGITPEEFSQVNLDQVDFSAWIESYVLPAVGDQVANLLERMQLP